MSALKFLWKYTYIIWFYWNKNCDINNNKNKQPSLTIVHCTICDFSNNKVESLFKFEDQNDMLYRTHVKCLKRFYRGIGCRLYVMCVDSIAEFRIVHKKSFWLSTFFKRTNIAIPLCIHMCYTIICVYHSTFIELCALVFCEPAMLT